MALPGCSSGAGLSQKTPVAVTGRHLAAFQGQAGPGLRAGSTHTLGHQDGFLSYFQDVC